MNSAPKRPADGPPAPVRCAIYTRKSTEEGLEQEFNSLMAQREAAEAYILSQREQGWSAVPDHYSDGGFSGGNMERPALKRLLADVEAKRVDCVVVYKVDRLSRSLLDFAAIIGLLDKHGVTFVSVTQQFNTNTSLGRLTLNILLSFAQFERELISERTRDKVFAARRKGKWTGGQPMLGYDLDARGGKIHVNESEAPQVREVFEIYARTRSLIRTLDEIDRRGWRAKSWITRKEKRHGGQRFTRHTLQYLLMNPIYLGQVRLKGELHRGEHAAIVDPELWRKVNALLASSARSPASRATEPQTAPLRGLLFCAACGTPMAPTYTKRNAVKVRYYTCLSAQQRGWKTCPRPALPAAEIEGLVFARLNTLGFQVPKDEAMLAKCIVQVAHHGKAGEIIIMLRDELVTAPDQDRMVRFPIPLPKPRRRRKSPPAFRTPRISRLMALAIRFESLLKQGTVKDYADLARLGHVTRTRMTQIMNLLNLAPDIQESLLFLPQAATGRGPISERACRPLVDEPSWKRQRTILEDLLATAAN